MLRFLQRIKKRIQKETGLRKGKLQSCLFCLFICMLLGRNKQTMYRTDCGTDTVLAEARYANQLSEGLIFTYMSTAS
jgi:hypothetical protein